MVASSFHTSNCVNVEILSIRVVEDFGIRPVKEVHL